MARQHVRPILLTLAIALIMVACGGGSNAEPTTAPTVDPIQQSVSQTVAAISVAQTVAALTGPTTTPPPPDTESSNTQPTITAEPVVVEPSPTAPVANLATDAPVPENAPTCTTVTGVNIRSGPGTAYEPPVDTLPGGATLVPIGYVARGFPQGEWLQVQIATTGQTAWVSAGTQFVSCTVSPASLPVPAAIPPTPRPTATPTPLPATATPTRAVAGLPPNVTNDIPGGECERTDNIKTRIQEDPNFLYRVYARDDRAGENDGDGIDFVRFTIFGPDGEVYKREEGTAGYCIFGGGEPICNNWRFNDQGQFTWGQGGPVVSPGTYQVFIEVVSLEPDPATESNVCNWNFDMTVTLP